MEKKNEDFWKDFDETFAIRTCKEKLAEIMWPGLRALQPRTSLPFPNHFPRTIFRPYPPTRP
jgi:hypothetical protein